VERGYSARERHQGGGERKEADTILEAKIRDRVVDVGWRGRDLVAWSRGASGETGNGDVAGCTVLETGGPVNRIESREGI
jgi:hypothetical protein